MRKSRFTGAPWVPVALVAVGAATLALAPSAQAQAGASGHANTPPKTASCNANASTFTSTGWAYNPDTAPVQTVVMKIYENVPGQSATLVDDTGADFGVDAFSASGYDSSHGRDDAFTVHSRSCVAFAAKATGETIVWWAHDKGTTGGWTQIGSYSGPKQVIGNV